jgi:hypothetical protein
MASPTSFLLQAEDSLPATWPRSTDFFTLPADRKIWRIYKNGQLRDGVVEGRSKFLQRFSLPQSSLSGYSLVTPRTCHLEKVNAPCNLFHLSKLPRDSLLAPTLRCFSGSHVAQDLASVARCLQLTRTIGIREQRRYRLARLEWTAHLL